jgi:hypothetical protein
MIESLIILPLAKVVLPLANLRLGHCSSSSNATVDDALTDYPSSHHSGIPPLIDATGEDLSTHHPW